MTISLKQLRISPLNILCMDYSERSESSSEGDRRWRAREQLSLVPGGSRAEEWRGAPPRELVTDTIPTELLQKLTQDPQDHQILLTSLAVPSLGAK